MPRAKRYHIPGYVWHITHRWHKREFLLKFVRDRRRWVQWLFEAKKRFGYNADYGAENAVLSFQNRYFWNVNYEYSAD